MKRHPIIATAIVAGCAFAVWALPARAATVRIGDSLVINFGEVAPWIAILITIAIWWDARKAKLNAAAAALSAASADAKIGTVSKQVDGLLADRDKAKVIEGKIEEKKIGERVAETLAEGQRQGREAERASVAAGPSASGGASPLPVADDRTAIAGERVAKATERSANAAQRVADAAVKK